MKVDSRPLAQTHELLGTDGPGPTVPTGPLPPIAPPIGDVFGTGVIVDVFPTQPPPPPAVDVNAAFDAFLTPLAELVEGGKPPPAGAQPSGPGDMTGLSANQLPEYFAALFADVATMLGYASADQLPAELKAAMQDMLLTTHGLELPLDPAAQNAIKPSPALIAEVAQMMRDSGQLPSAGAPSGGKKGAPAAHEGIVIPGPVMVKLEAGFKSSSFDLSNCDIETAVSIIMFQAGAEADQDLRDMIKDMDKNRANRDTTRRLMSAMREQQAAAERQLRKEYDARRKLSPDDEDYIPEDVSFDDYKAQRQLEFPLNGDGVFDGSSGVGLPSDWPIFEPPPPPSTDDDGGVAGTGGTSGTGETGGTGGVGGAEPLTPEQQAICTQFNLSAPQLRSISAVYDLLSTLFPEVKEGAPTLAQFLANPTLPTGTIAAPHGSGGWLGGIADALGGGGLPEQGMALTPGASAQENALALGKLFESVSGMLSEGNVMAMLERRFTEMTALEFFSTIEDGTGGTAADSIPRLKRQLAEYQSKLGAVFSAASELFGSAFVVKWQEKKCQLFEAMKQDLTKQVINTGREDFDDMMNFIMHQKLPSSINAMQSGPAKTQAIERLKANCQALQNSPAISSFIRIGREMNLPYNAIADLLSTDGADDRLGRTYFNERSDDGAVDGPFTRELKQARADNAASPTTGSHAALMDAIKQGIAANKHPGPHGDLRLQVALQANVTATFETAQGQGAEPPADEGAEHLGGASGDSKQGTLADFETMIQAKRDELDSQNDLNDAASLRLQMYMDRRSKIHTTLSNLLKNFSDTKGVIVGNLK